MHACVAAWTRHACQQDSLSVPRQQALLTAGPMPAPPARPCSEDIMQQMPNEGRKFKAVDAIWRRTMGLLAKNAEVGRQREGC